MNDAVNQLEDVGVFLYSKELEEALLANCLLLPHSAEEHPIEEKDFYIHKHRFIWNAFCAIRESGNTPEVTSIVDELDRQGKLEEVGGSNYLYGLLTGVVNTAGIGGMLARLKDYKARRLLLNQSQWIGSKVLDMEYPVDKIQDQVVMALSSFSLGDRTSRHIREVVSDVFDDARKAAKNPAEVWGIPTGLLDYDRLTGGLHLAETTFLAGAPGTGKSILANQIGLQVSQEVPVWLVSLEMKDKRLVKRLLSAEAEIPTRSISTGMMDETMWDELVDSCENVSQRDIHIWDERGMTLSEFRAEATRLVRMYGVKVIVLDYLFLMAGYEDLKMVPRTEILSNSIQNLAEQLNVHIIVINSVVKEGMKNYNPTVADLRGSGQLIHDADTVVFIQKKAMTGEMLGSTKRIRELVFMKMRDSDQQDNVAIQLLLTTGYPKFETPTTREAPLDLSGVSTGTQRKDDPGYQQAAMDRFTGD